MGLEDRALLALLAGHDRVELSERMVRGASNWTLDARVRCPDNQSLSQSLSLATLIVQTLLTERLFGAVVGASATRRGRLDRRHALLTRHLSSCDGIDQMSMLNSTLRYVMMPSHDTAPPRTTPAAAASAVISHSLLHLPAARQCARVAAMRSVCAASRFVGTAAFSARIAPPLEQPSELAVRRLRVDVPFRADRATVSPDRLALRSANRTLRVVGAAGAAADSY